MSYTLGDFLVEPLDDADLRDIVRCDSFLGSDIGKSWIAREAKRGHSRAEIKQKQWSCDLDDICYYDLTADARQRQLIASGDSLDECE